MGNGTKMERVEKRTKFEANYEEKLEQLLQFKASFGHTNVPTNYKQDLAFGMWCNEQRNGIIKGLQNKNALLN